MIIFIKVGFIEGLLYWIALDYTDVPYKLFTRGLCLDTLALTWDQFLILFPNRSLKSSETLCIKMDKEYKKKNCVSRPKHFRQQPLKQPQTEGIKCTLCKFQQAEPA